MQRTPLERLAMLAGMVFIADFASKRWALDHLTDGTVLTPLAGGVHFALVNNTRLAGGLQTGGFELQITALATIAVALVVARIYRPLSELDASAPVMLGLLLGAGAANLADALVPPHGVVDFIGVTTPTGVTTTFNVADVAAAAGLALCARTAWRLVQIMRGRRQRVARPMPNLAAGVTAMRHHLLASSGHALLGMCLFVWVYSMAIALTPDAGRSAPSALLLGVAVFAVVFAASHVLRWATSRRMTVTVPQPALGRVLERVVLEGSIANSRHADVADAPPETGKQRERSVRRDRPLTYTPRPPAAD